MSLGTIVTLVAVLALHQGPSPVVERYDPLPLTVSAETHVGAQHLVLVHTGGADVDMASVRVHVAAGLTTLFDGPVGAAGLVWHHGEFATLLLASPVPPGAPLSVLVVHEVAGVSAHGAATVNVDPVAPPPELEGLAASVFFGNGADRIVANGTETVVIELLVDHPSGRKLVASVTGRLAGVQVPPVEFHDDGTRGDAVARDGLYVGTLQLPLDVAPGLYPTTVTVVDLNGARSYITGLVEVLPPVVIPPDPLRPMIPPFEILPTGGVRPRCAGPLVLEVVGVDITYGATGPRIPVYAWSTRNGGATFSPLYGGVPVARGMQESFVVGPGDIVGVRGQANGFGFVSTWNSWSADPHVRVLRDGDLPPDVPAFGTLQTDIAVYLAPYIENGRIALAEHEVIVLFEFNPDLASTAADFQDLVILYDFIAGNCPG